MKDAKATGATPSPDVAPVVVRCVDLDAAIAHYTRQPGYRLDMIMPADEPRVALVSGGGTLLRLEAADRDVPIALSGGTGELVISRAATGDAWVKGRAGMQYRDLVPGRLGGCLIASQIRIPGGGPVSDYVHYHKVRFQMIYCRRGWVRVVYEDQGPPFVMHPGDCVLQPPTIRHRVIEASAGLEVIEIGCPAEHETWRDHELELPTAQLRPERSFGGQRFLRHVAADAVWKRFGDARFEFRDTGISAATGGFAGVRVLRALSGEDAKEWNPERRNEGKLAFLAVLDGRIRLHGQVLGTHTLETGDACTIPPGAAHELDGVAPGEVLEVTLAVTSPQPGSHS